MGGQGPITGQLNHFYGAAPPDQKEARDYGVVRYGMEAMRLMDVLNQHLSDGRKFLCGDEYTIADMACFPWAETRRGGPQEDFLTLSRYSHLLAWCACLPRHREALARQRQVQAPRQALSLEITCQ